MTRRRFLLALVVTVLAVGCAAPWWEKAWLAVAYTEARSTANAPPQLYRLSREWLPGETKVLWAEQVCSHCSMDVDSDHWCLDETSVPLAWIKRGAAPVVPLQMIGYASSGPGPAVEVEWGPEGVLSCTCPTCHPERQ